MLRQRALKATLWSALDSVLRQGVQLVTLVVLARLLSPAEFGTFALITLFTGIASLIMDGGFSAALIQRQDASQTDQSTVFWFNLTAGFVAAIGLWAISPAVASFYGSPALAPLLALMGLNTILGAFGAIHVSLLTKALDFKSQSKAGFIAALASGVLAIWMASEGWGIWALAGQAITYTACNSSLLWLFARWRPTVEFSTTSFRSLAGFGGYQFASAMMDVIYSRLYTVLIGKVDGVKALGYYGSAESVQQMPSGALTKLLTRVAFPIFAVTSDDPEKLRRGMQVGVRGSMLVNIPIMLGMASVAEPLVLVLFGPKWAPAVPLLRILSLSAVLQPLHALNLNCLLAQGHSQLMFKVEVVKKLVGTAILGAGAIFGVIGIAWAMVVFSVAGLTINAHYTKKFLAYGAIAQARDILPILVCGLVMVVVVTILSMYWNASPLIKLAGLVTVGAATFCIFILLLRTEALADLHSLLRPATSEQPPAKHLV